ncbi:MAG: tRNA methyl transferase PRC-barrel domain-containing protein [Candidatus Pacearchaeota archaeon]
MTKKLLKQNQKTVLVAMSGGVDSSVAALLMKQHGFEVIGVFMKNWSDTKDPITGECSWREDRAIAQKIAAKLNIPLITLDFEKQYRKQVVDEMFKKYKKGITPNPDIDCNEKVKFPLLLKALEKLKADYLVTGHYARIKKIKLGNKKSVNSKNKLREQGSSIKNYINERAEGEHYTYELFRAKDETKDQSYFLYRLKQSELAKTLFPIGDYTKKQIREIAQKAGFQNFDRKSTIGICFIGKVNLKQFLQKKIKPKPGKILNPDGKVIGKHDGIYYYTIGQRIGQRFGIEVEKAPGIGGSMRKWYVARKDAKTNTIIAAPEGHKLNFRKEIFIKDAYWINEVPFSKKNKIVNLKTSRVDSTIKSYSHRQAGWAKSIKVLSRIRQVGELLPSTLKYLNGNPQIILNKPITGVSEGQAIVLYQGEKVLGGGVISFS